MVQFTRTKSNGSTFVIVPVFDKERLQSFGGSLSKECQCDTSKEIELMVIYVLASFLFDSTKEGLCG